MTYLLIKSIYVKLVKVNKILANVQDVYQFFIVIKIVK